MTLNGNLPLGGLDRIIEVAEHAFGQYITNGPSVPPESMNVPGLEGVRSRLARSPCADHHEAAGWVAVEQAFAIAGSPKLSSRYPIAPLFDAANESFTVALGRHDETVDQPRQLLEIKLAMAALAIYAPWAAGEGISGKTASTFHEEAAEVGRGLLDLNDRLSETVAGDRLKQQYANGLASEMIVLLAFNRRQTGGDVASLAVPSTLRQNRSVRKGKVGSGYDKSQLRGNWDLSVIGRRDEVWGLSDKLQVKSALTLAGKDWYGKQQQAYTDNITVIGVKDHILATLPDVDTWEALKILTGAGASGSASQQKKHAATMSRELYGYIERDRARRGLS